MVNRSSYLSSCIARVTEALETLAFNHFLAGTEKSLSFRDPRFLGASSSWCWGVRRAGVDRIKLIPKSVTYAGFFTFLLLLFSVGVGGPDDHRDSLSLS